MPSSSPEGSGSHQGLKRWLDYRPNVLLNLDLLIDNPYFFGKINSTNQNIKGI